MFKVGEVKSVQFQILTTFACGHYIDIDTDFFVMPVADPGFELGGVDLVNGRGGA